MPVADQVFELAGRLFLSRSYQEDRDRENGQLVGDMLSVFLEAVVVYGVVGVGVRSQSGHSAGARPLLRSWAAS